MVFFAILLPMIFGFMGLGIDASLVYVNKGKVQDIADAAALAGAAHLGEEGDSVRTAVEKYVKANGVDITSNDMVSVPSDGWDSLDELDDDKSLRVAYGVVNVDGKDRLRVRIDKRVPLPFTSAFIPDWSKGMPVSSVAAAEGGAMQVPPFRIIGRNGVKCYISPLSPASDNNTCYGNSYYEYYSNYCRNNFFGFTLFYSRHNLTPQN